MRQREIEAQAAREHMSQCYLPFKDHLTTAQLDAWIAKDTVPRAKDHQRRYKAYEIAFNEYKVLRARAAFVLLQGEKLGA